MDITGASLKKTGYLMDLIASKQEAIAENIANMHTPNYKRKDVDFAQYIGSQNSSLETKLSEKLGPSGVVMPYEGEQMTAEDELAIMQKNYILYSIASKKMTSTITEIKTVINVGT